MPDTNSIVEITVAVSFCSKKMLNMCQQNTKSTLREHQIYLSNTKLTSDPPMVGTTIKGMNISEPAIDK